MTILITGSSGLIGSEAVEHFDRLGRRVIGIDNNQREAFFGPAGDTTWNLRRFMTQALWFHHWRDIPEDRIWAEGLGLLGMIAMGFGWFWEFRHRRPPGS